MDYKDTCPIYNKSKIDVWNHLMWFHPQIHLVEWIMECKKNNSENPPVFLRHHVSDEK